MDETVQYYRTSSEGVTPHFLVGPETVQQFVDLDRVAYHVGMTAEHSGWYTAGRTEWTRHTKDGTHLEQPFPGYSDWLARWLGVDSPAGLLSGLHPNGSSVGIEMLAERGQCTDAQYLALGELLRQLSGQLGLELKKETILGHYDCDPIARSSVHGGTDPGPAFDWDRVYDLTLR